MHLRYDPRPIAERLWREVGYRPTFPRDLLPPLMETFEAAVVFIPRLSILSINEWLLEHRREPIAGQRERTMRGCLLARRGHALIFLDGSISPEERNFALAHEWAHYFAHYLEPRRRAVTRFGRPILPVLDGERTTTIAERLSSIISEVPIGPFMDFLGRDEAGRPAGSVLDIETEADLIALELLAPCDEVMRWAKPGPQLSLVLQNRFGLPSWAAAEWARFVLSLQPRSDPVILGIERAIRKKM